MKFTNELIIASIGCLAFSSLVVYGIIFYTPNDWETWMVALLILSLTTSLGIFFMYLFNIERQRLTEVKQQ